MSHFLVTITQKINPISMFLYDYFFFLFSFLGIHDFFFLLLNFRESVASDFVMGLEDMHDYVKTLKDKVTNLSSRGVEPRLRV